mmetsp:Transcript_126942/g.365114  ORF Transcript_126942/g.365114 Transcript_126942/m.365114 type:complete len:223 (+) Transcript_126942:575-1243(+)
MRATKAMALPVSEGTRETPCAPPMRPLMPHRPPLPRLRRLRPLHRAAQPRTEPRPRCWRRMLAGCDHRRRCRRCPSTPRGPMPGICGSRARPTLRRCRAATPDEAAVLPSSPRRLPQSHGPMSRAVTPPLPPLPEPAPAPNGPLANSKAPSLRQSRAWATSAATEAAIRPTSSLGRLSAESGGTCSRCSPRRPRPRPHPSWLCGAHMDFGCCRNTMPLRRAA